MMNVIRHNYPSPIQCLRVFSYWSLLRSITATTVTAAIVTATAVTAATVTVAIVAITLLCY